MRILSFDELETQKGIKLSRERIRRMRKVGDFPEPLAVGTNSVAWREDEIDLWIESRPRAAAPAARGIIADERQIDLPLVQEAQLAEGREVAERKSDFGFPLVASGR